MLQRQRDHGIARVLVGQIEPERIGHPLPKRDDAVVGDFADNGSTVCRACRP